MITNDSDDNDTQAKTNMNADDRDNSKGAPLKENERLILSAQLNQTWNKISTLSKEKVLCPLFFGVAFFHAMERIFIDILEIYHEYLWNDEYKYYALLGNLVIHSLAKIRIYSQMGKFSRTSILLAVDSRIGSIWRRCIL